MNTRFKKLKSQTPGLVFLVLSILLLSSHDLYLKLETYFLEPHQKASLSLYNGTFESSENIITRDRMLDASIVSHGQSVSIDSSDWQDLDSTITYLDFTVGEPGTYVAGVSTKARNIELSAEKFNSYLEHDGVLDMLELRKQNKTVDQDAIESYQKHVKAIYQVGDSKTEDWKTILNYPIEFVPQENPYDKYSGDSLKVKLILEGKPLSQQLIYADHIKSNHTHSHGDHEHNHDHSEDGHSHTNGQKIRTDSEGFATVHLPEDGLYYLRTIYMETVSDSTELTHRSKWATLTFEVTHSHDSSGFYYFIGGAVLALILFIFVLFSSRSKS